MDSYDKQSDSKVVCASGRHRPFSCGHIMPAVFFMYACYLYINGTSKLSNYQEGKPLGMTRRNTLSLGVLQKISHIRLWLDLFFLTVHIDKVLVLVELLRPLLGRWSTRALIQPWWPSCKGLAVAVPEVGISWVDRVCP